MLSSQEYQLVAVLCYYFQLSSPLKMEECIKLLSWPTPLSREYQLSAVRLFIVLLYGLLITLSSQTGRMYQTSFMAHAFESRVFTSLLPCYTVSYYLSPLKLEECIKLLSWPIPLS